MKKFNFKKSLVAGKLGEDIFAAKMCEDIFAAKMCDKVIRLDGRKSDFKLIADGKLIELKSEYYDKEKTPNFFIERYSNIDKKSAGGPWQALEKGSDYFVEFFPINNYIWVFNTKSLVERLDILIKSLNLGEIINDTHVSAGYLVKRELLQDLVIQEKEI